MLTWFIYDITSNRTRSKIAKTALQCGLYRVQKSVFLGNIDSNRLEEITMKSEQIMNLKTDSLYAFPMCDKDFKNVILKGRAFDKEMISDEVKAFFI